jgi:hypothetical protein
MGTLEQEDGNLLKMLTSEDRTAGVGTFLLLLKGVNMASDEYSDVSRKAQIENSVQMARREQEVRVEAEKLHLTLEVEKKKSLELIAAIWKRASRPWCRRGGRRGRQGGWAGLAKKAGSALINCGFILH